MYTQPRTAFVANFLGRSNLLSGTADRHMARTALGIIPLQEPRSGPVLVSVRPEHLRFTDDPAAPEVTIQAREFKGHDITYTVTLDGNRQELLVHGPSDDLRPEGSRARLSVTQPARPVQ